MTIFEIEVLSYSDSYYSLRSLRNKLPCVSRPIILIAKPSRLLSVFNINKPEAM